MTRVPPALRNRLGIAVARRTYAAYRELLASPRWQALSKAGAQPQRLLWASTSTKDPSASDVLYVEALAAPDTINTIPEDTLRAFADHGHVTQTMPADGGDAEDVLGRFARAGVDVAALGDQLQREGAQSFDDSWNKLMRMPGVEERRTRARRSIRREQRDHRSITDPATRSPPGISFSAPAGSIAGAGESGTSSRSRVSIAAPRAPSPRRGTLCISAHRNTTAWRILVIRARNRQSPFARNHGGTS